MLNRIYHISPNIKTKQCSRCHSFLPATAEYFKRDARLSCGLGSQCKKCYNASQYVYRQKNIKVIRDRDCSYYAKNRDKLNLKARISYANNPDKYKLRSRIYRHKYIEKRRLTDKHYAKTHPQAISANKKRYRARKYGASIRDFTRMQWEAMQAHYDHRCVYCGKRRKGRLTQDHITPLSKGGNHTASNIVPACRNCNSRKHTGNPPVPVQPLLLTE